MSQFPQVRFVLVERIHQTIQDDILLKTKGNKMNECQNKGVNLRTLIIAKVRFYSLFAGFVFGFLLMLTVGIVCDDFVGALKYGAVGSWIGLFLGYVFGIQIARKL